MATHTERDTFPIAGLARAVVEAFLPGRAGVRGDRAYDDLNGVDPAFARESPGTLLVGHAIAGALSGGAREFDFLRGRERYKYLWGARDRWNQRRSFRRGEA